MFRPQSSRPPTASSLASNNTNSKLSHQNNSESSPTRTTSTTTTIREIRSRSTVGSNISASPRHLLVSKRQAASMERLNSGSSSSSTLGNGGSHGDKEKSSPSSGSSTSINGGLAGSNSSPQRSSNVGLNRTASRVSRFRSAKAVFERLTNNSSSSSSSTSSGGSANKPERLIVPEKPKGTVASRYAAAAAARATAQQQASANNTSPRSRIQTGSSLSSRLLDSSTKSASSTDIHRSSYSSVSSVSSSQPKPQPRVITTNRMATQISITNPSSTTSNDSHQASSKAARPLSSVAVGNSKMSIAQAKPPPRDLIDKIVFEIARDQTPQDPDCTIQDLSNCDISGIPETLDFDKCFQDVEMMTEEEARKLLSRKSSATPSPDKQPAWKSSSLSNPNEAGAIKKTDPEENKTSVGRKEEEENAPDEVASRETTELQKASNTDEESAPAIAATTAGVSIVTKQDATRTIETPTDLPPQTAITATSSVVVVGSGGGGGGKSKVRFSEEPVKIFNTHAVEDYDRRNEDIDPIAASAEYEIEKSKEREGIRDSDDEDEENLIGNGAVKKPSSDSNGSIIQAKHDKDCCSCSSSPCSSAGTPRNSHSGHHRDHHHDRTDHSNGHHHLHDFSGNQVDDGELKACNKEHIESLEREVSLKKILEQNLRDLQSQYYEAVRELDDYKGESKTKLSELEKNFADVTSKFESSQIELNNSREQSSQLIQQLNDIKDSSQLLEKKYHRAKKIIKDLQSREQSFNRREQLYQQKLDEIEHELGVLVSSINKTIYDDGLNYYSIVTDNNTTTICQRKHQARLDVFSLLKHILDNFGADQSTQNQQIKQRVMSILEQQLANLMVLANGNTSILGEASVMVGVTMSQSSTMNLSSDISQLQQMDIIDSAGKNHNQNPPPQTYNNHIASHRLSQPNLPHPIGVSGQPTKLFQGLSHQIPLPATVNEPSPPQSVNSYPSTNSLNSLNNNNNNNNTLIISSKQPQANSNNEQQLPTSNIMSSSIVPLSSSLSTSTTSKNEEKFQPALDIQVPYQTSEWHEKPVSEWTTTQVSTWLLALGLDQYISKFEDRNVNGQSLINLDSTVLKGLGVLNSNDRNLLKKKIRELRTEMEKERKLVEKKLKENLKEKSKNKNNSNGSRTDNNRTDAQQQNKSWKKSLLS